MSPPRFSPVWLVLIGILSVQFGAWSPKASAAGGLATWCGWAWPPLGITLFSAGPARVDAVGFGLALFAGGCWALYIVSTAATGRRWAGVEGLAVASTIAALPIAPFAVVVAGERLLEPRLLVLGALVGPLSSVVPTASRWWRCAP